MSKINCTAPSGKKYTWTEKSLEKDIQKQLEKLISTAADLKGSRSLREIAERVILRELGTEKERCVLAFMLENEKELGLHLDYHYRYDGDTEPVREMFSETEWKAMKDFK